MLFCEIPTVVECHFGQTSAFPVFPSEAGNRCKERMLPEETTRIVEIISDVNMAYSEQARTYLHEADCK
jgi:UDP-N-acetylglucosamine 2-epimerase